MREFQRRQRADIWPICSSALAPQGHRDVAGRGAGRRTAGVRDATTRNIFPMVTPLAMDPAHRFPFISNLSLNLLVTLRFPGEHRDLHGARQGAGRRLAFRASFAVGADTFVPGRRDGAITWTCSFPGMEIAPPSNCSGSPATPSPSRDEEHADDLLEMIETELRERQFRADRPAGGPARHGPDPSRHAGGRAGPGRGTGRLRGRRHDGHARPLRDRRARPARAARPAAPSGRPPAAGQRPAQHLPHHPRERADPAAAPLRVLHAPRSSASCATPPTIPRCWRSR